MAGADVLDLWALQGESPETEHVRGMILTVNVNPDMMCRWHIPSQLHMYMETPVAVVEPDEGGMLSVHAAAQGIDSCQSTVARVMGMPCNHVRVGAHRCQQPALFLAVLVANGLCCFFVG